jgi:hypothetical protein
MLYDLHCHYFLYDLFYDQNLKLVHLRVHVYKVDVDIFLKKFK